MAAAAECPVVLHFFGNFKDDNLMGTPENTKLQ